MARYEVSVVDVVRRCPDVLSVRLEKPEGYRYLAGQYLTLGLRTVGGGVERKPFTHSSAPHDPHLEVTTRLSDSAFKAAFERLGPGDTVTIAGPAGRFRVPATVRKVAFLAGGVGITPVISMLRSWAEEGGGPDSVVLFYGNREQGCVPFAEELAALGTGTLDVVRVLEAPPEEWAGERGLITPETVRRHIDPAGGWLFAVAGPPVMVSAMEACLDELGVPGEHRLVERFGPSSAAR